MLRPEEAHEHVLPKEYVLEHGVSYWELSDEYYTDENGVYHYERMFDKPMDEGGKPFTGIAYELLDDDFYAGYTEYRDGYQHGIQARFTGTGSLCWFSCVNGEENYIYTWYDSGVLKETVESYRQDEPTYKRIKQYDENGRPVTQRIIGEISLVHNFDAPDPAFELTWHDNGEFRLIRYVSPTSSVFYSEIELDEKGYPIRSVLNPHYSPEFLSPEKYAAYWKLKNFDKGYRFIGDRLMYPINDSWHGYSGRLCFRSSKGCIEKIMEFKDGLPCGGQYLYYPDGRLREHYCISRGREYNKHIWWHPNGVMQKAVIYSADKKTERTVCFDADGRVISDDAAKG